MFQKVVTSKEDGIQWEDPSSMAKKEDYILHNGRRYVRPYFFEFVAHVKKRWEGLCILDFFVNEFKQRDELYYRKAIEEGRIKVAHQTVLPSYRLRDAQTITHFVHRHEPPVYDEPVRVIFESRQLLIVHKPASVPVHPCGQYRKNTILSILQAEFGHGQLFPVHRLDRLVSGLLIIAKDSSTADRFRKQIVEKTVRKEYIARVRGAFPEGEIEVNKAIAYDSAEGKSRVQEEDSGGDFERDKKRVKRGKSQLQDSHGAAKMAVTKFKLRGTDGTTSLVECYPLTGRTHQIRVHLQNLGFPIANDPLYCPESLAPPLGESCCSEESLVKFEIDSFCSQCPSLAPKGCELEGEGLWLHCCKYSGSDWTFECPLPKWATQKFFNVAESDPPLPFSHECNRN